MPAHVCSLLPPGDTHLDEVDVATMQVHLTTKQSSNKRATEGVVGEGMIGIMIIAVVVGGDVGSGNGEAQVATRRSESDKEEKNSSGKLAGRSQKREPEEEAGCVWERKRS